MEIFYNPKYFKEINFKEETTKLVSDPWVLVWVFSWCTFEYKIIHAARDLWEYCHGLCIAKHVFEKKNGTALPIPQLVLNFCLFKSSRALSRRDFNAWANLRPQNQIWNVASDWLLSEEILLLLPQQPNQPTVTSSASLGHPHKPTASPTSSTQFPPNSIIPVYRRDERRNTSYKMGLKTSSSFSLVFPFGLWVFCACSSMK